MGKVKIQKNEYQKIVDIYKNGLSQSEIAEIYGVTTSRIGQILRENGLNVKNSRYLNFSQEEQQKIVNLYKQGVSAVKIGEMFKCSKSPITKVLHLNGIELDTHLRKISKSDYQKIIDMYNYGMTQQEIADVYGCSKNAVNNVMKQLNVTARPNGLTKEQAAQMYALYETGVRLPEIAKLYNVDRHTVGRAFTRNGFATDRKTYHCNEHYFDKIDNQDKAYILGLLWSDGCNQVDRGKVTIQLQERDKQILEQIRDISHNERPLWKSVLNDKNPKWQNSIVLTWQSKNISQVLNDYGMVSRKSLILEFPSWMDKTLYPHFIRGYMDGDGSIYYSHDRKTFRASMVGTKMFLNVIKEICEANGIKTSIYYNNKHSNITCTLSTTSNCGTINFLNWIYEDASLKLQRKYDKYQQALYDRNINNSLAS